jgi:hypothetical protein
MLSYLEHFRLLAVFLLLAIPLVLLLQKPVHQTRGAASAPSRDEGAQGGGGRRRATSSSRPIEGTYARSRNR